MSEHEFRLKSGCTEKWAFAGAVEEIRRLKLDDVKAVECTRCGFWHLRLTEPMRMAA